MKTILYVDDEVGTLRALSKLLRREGFEVLEAADGAEGLRICERHGGDIDLLLVDYHMPPMNGPVFVTQARGLRARAKVLYYSGFVLIDTPENYVMKGCDFSVLLAAIRRKLAEP